MEEIKLPYGESNFKILREEGYIYVDKTGYIKTLEKNYKKVMYVRPRRFGKSLFTSMLACYYDLAEKENYDTLFKGLEIYNHSTEKRNSYYILRFNFSSLDSSSEKESREQFNKTVLIDCEKFIKKYHLDIEIEDREASANIILKEILAKFSVLGKENKIYVIIDEYDHFTNSLLEEDVSKFEKVSKAGGFVRLFYEAIKTYCEEEPVIDRFFATGVAPLSLDSLTSGFNIATNISLDSDFIAMCGLEEKEVKNLVKRCGLDESIYQELEKNYDGYKFCKTSEKRTFNVTLLLYYLKNYVIKNGPPEDLVDQNLETSLDKIKSLVNLVNPKENYEKLVELVTTGEVSGTLINRFDITKEGFNVDSFLSLLFYQGYITIKEVGMVVKFKVPNYVSEVLYANYFSKLVDTKEKYKLETDEIKNSIVKFGEEGKIDVITKVVSNFLTYQSVRDRENFNERTLKYVYSLFFSLSNQYYVYGEFPALQGFADLFIEKTESSAAKYEAVIELKYLSKEKAEGANLDKLKEDGVVQLKSYLEDKRLVTRENLKKFVVIFSGFDKYTIFDIDKE